MIMSPRTSLSHPLDIAACAAPDGGVVGFSMCPGRQDRDGVSGGWDRDLERDLADAARWGATMMVGLLDAREIRCLGVDRIPLAAQRMGINFFPCPIPDGGVPQGERSEQSWRCIAACARKHLNGGGRVMYFCRAGRGRSAMCVACLLVTLGTDVDDAISTVRSARPGALQSPKQVEYVRALNLSRFLPD